MKKTYKYQLPQNKEVKSTGVRIENGEILVDVEFKEKFKPKDGDFLVSSRGNVFIYNGKCTSIEYGAYCGIDVNDVVIICKYISVTWTDKEGCRYATEQEKADFLERLEKELHKRWNAETKQLEDIRWRPEENEIYWFVDEGGCISHTSFTILSSNDRLRIANNNCFKTKEATQPYADQIKDILKNSKAE